MACSFTRSQHHRACMVLDEEKGDRTGTKNVEDLVAILNSVWDSIDQNHIDNLVTSIPRRLNALIQNKGAQIIGHI